MSLMDLSDVVLDLSDGTYTVTRAGGPGTYTAGVFVPASMSTVQVVALITPLLSGPQLLRLPEGLRSMNAIEIFATVELRVDAPGQHPDVITFNGHDWQIDVVDDWLAAGGFYHAVATKVS